MTSACQAGIMFGNNYDIPAYRWYDKSKQKLYVSADDATELNAVMPRSGSDAPRLEHYEYARWRPREVNCSRSPT